MRKFTISSTNDSPRDRALKLRIRVMVAVCPVFAARYSSIAGGRKKAAAAAASPYPRLILQDPHPSPLSAYRGFFGSRPFSKINAFLTAHGEAEIQW